MRICDLLRLSVHALPCSAVRSWVHSVQRGGTQQLCTAVAGYCERNDIGVQKKAVVPEAAAKGTQ